MLAKFSRIESYRTVLKFRKIKNKIAVFIRRERKFHFVVGQLGQRNEQKRRDARVKLLLISVYCFLAVLVVVPAFVA